MAEQLHVSGDTGRVKAPRSSYTDTYPTEESLPRISSMDFMDHHADSDGQVVRTLSIFSGYWEVAGFPIDDYFIPSSDDESLHFKVHGFTYEDLEEEGSEQDEGHVKGYVGSRVVLLVLKGGVLPKTDDISCGDIEYQEGEDIVLSPYQLMILMDTCHSQLPIRGSAYGMRLFR